MCSEAGEFDFEGFVKKFDLNRNELDESYGIWNLAEKVSRGEIVEYPDPKLILQLVCLGGFSGFESRVAIEKTYTNWKNNIVEEFDICHHISSGYGLTYCAVRSTVISEENNALTIEHLIDVIGEQTGALLLRAYDSAKEFLNQKQITKKGMVVLRHLPLLFFLFNIKKTNT